MLIEYSEEHKYYEGKVRVCCKKELFEEETVELKVIFKSEKERNIEKEIEKIKYVKENFLFMYDELLNELFTWKEKYQLKFEARNEVGQYKQVEINKKEDLHKYMGNPLIELLFYKESIYVSFVYGDECVLSEDGISAVFLNNILLTVDAADVYTTFYNNIVYKLENENQ